MKISKKEVEYLAQVLTDNGLSKVEYSEDGYKIKLSKEQIIIDSKEAAQQVPASFNKSDVSEDVLDENIQEIRCPLIGHFYLTKTPNDPPYVKVGDVIQKGDVIGILQAMKVSNEIKSNVSGEVVEILVETGQFVDYDYVLMKVKGV